MKQKCPTYLKISGKSKALAVTLSNTEPKDDFGNEDDGILNAFIVTINPTEGIVEDVDEEELLVESKFEKIGEGTYINIYKPNISTMYVKTATRPIYKI